MQKWEYVWFKQIRGYRGIIFGGGAEAWSLEMPGSLSKYRVAGGDEILAMVNAMGTDGWELVNVVPGSNLGGAHSAGFTSERVWVFKRPKP